MHHTDVKKPAGDSNPTAGSTDHTILPKTASAIKMTGAKVIASAVHIIKIALICVAAIAPAACIHHMAATQATNCSVGCQDV